MKKGATITLVIGLALLSAGVVLPVMAYSLQGNSVGIVGGAGIPTLRYLFNRSLVNGWFTLQAFGVTITISSLFCLIFHKTTQAVCSLKTSGLSLGLSAVVSFGGYCVLSFLLCFYDAAPSRNPIRYSTSIMAGVASLAVCIVLFFMYAKQRKAMPSVKGVVIDLLFALLYGIPFFSMYTVLDNLLG